MSRCNACHPPSRRAPHHAYDCILKELHQRLELQMQRMYLQNDDLPTGDLTSPKDVRIVDRSRTADAVVQTDDGPISVNVLPQSVRGALCAALREVLVVSLQEGVSATEDWASGGHATRRTLAFAKNDADVARLLDQALASILSLKRRLHYAVEHARKVEEMIVSMPAVPSVPFSPSYITAADRRAGVPSVGTPERSHVPIPRPPSPPRMPPQQSSSSDDRYHEELRGFMMPGEDHHLRRTPPSASPINVPFTVPPRYPPPSVVQGGPHLCSPAYVPKSPSPSYDVSPLSTHSSPLKQVPTGLPRGGAPEVSSILSSAVEPLSVQQLCLVSPARPSNQNTPRSTQSEEALQYEAWKATFLASQQQQQEQQQQQQHS